MKSLVVTELSFDFLIQGLGLNPSEEEGLIGKVGRHEIQLVTSVNSNIDLAMTEVQIFYLGLIHAGDTFRSGDILMVGSDDFIDRAFRALDEMEQRGVVVNLTMSSDPNHLFVNKVELIKEVELWREKKVPFLCLLMMEPLDSEGKTKMVTLIRKILNKV
ncbi:MAG: hypothetical protein WA131_05295 [Desulfitobacteriaceae bacterium]